MKTQNKGFVPDGERGRCVSGIPGKDRRRTVHIAEREGRTSERRRGSLIVNASSCTYPIHVLDGRHRTHIISFWHHSIPHTGISLRCTVFIRRRGVPYEIETMSARNLAGCQGGRAGQCLECMCLLVCSSTGRHWEGTGRGKRTECLCGTLCGMMLQPVQMCVSSRSLVTPFAPFRANLIVLARSLARISTNSPPRRNMWHVTSLLLLLLLFAECVSSSFRWQRIPRLLFASQTVPICLARNLSSLLPRI
uniref:Uncharacterized protein n=1 Tax=Wuchereria bancrofti TaxID=6293 RepID=A0AAF5RVU5_WUCBA